MKTKTEIPNKKITNSPNFKKWFGKSKVVDEDKKPLVVYHGGAFHITQFDERYGGDNTANNEHGAFYFTDNYDVAEDYSRQAYLRLFDGRSDEEIEDWVKEHIKLSDKDVKAIKKDKDKWIQNNFKVVNAYLRFENPLIIELDGELMPVLKMQEIIGFAKKQIWFDGVEEYFEPIYNQDDIDSYREDIENKAREIYDLSNDEEISESKLSHATQEYLEENNIYPEYPTHDGIIVRNTVDNIGDASNLLTDIFIAFEPEQIKLADGSNTTFDINNPDIRFKKGGEINNDETYKKWKSLVNMSKSELEKFYNSKEGKEAGLSSSEAKEKGINSGRESARWIMKMKDTSVSEWTDDMWKWSKKQISFISRMRGNKGGLYDEKGIKTRKHTSLLIWGHNPEIKFSTFETHESESLKRVETKSAFSLLFHLPIQ